MLGSEVDASFEIATRLGSKDVLGLKVVLCRCALHRRGFVYGGSDSGSGMKSVVGAAIFRGSRGLLVQRGAG